MNIKHFCKATQLISRIRVIRLQNAASHNVCNQNVLAITTSTAFTQQQEQQKPLYLHHQQKQQEQQENANPACSTSKFMILSGFFGFLTGKNEDDQEETPEEKLISTIKRCVLCVQKQQYDKAEQMLHLALRMAQDIQSKDGITYIFDLMANLAMEREQFKKAEKLFTDVMKRLFTDGHTEESPKILHISSKIAHMAQLQGDLEKAHQGFVWTLQRLTKLVKAMPQDKDLQELCGLTKNWFGQLLMKQGKYEEAKNLFEEAYNCLLDVYGAVNDASVTILNNISVAYVNLENYAEARKNLLRAMDIAKELKDVTQEGILQANLGLVYLHEGLLQQAQDACKLAWQMGKKNKNHDALEQAEYCLNEIKSSQKR